MKVIIYSKDIYSYGAMLISGILKEKHNYDVKLVRNLSENNLFLNSDVVIFSLYSTLNILDENIKNTIELIKKSGKTRVYVAGPVSAYPEIILNELNLDGVILGEGELTTPEIILGGKNGLAYFKNDEIIKNNVEKKPELDFSKIYIPKDIEKQTVRGANIYMETHRGCLGHCTFCQVPEFFGRDIRSKPLELILNEVKALKRRGVNRIAISGGTGSLYNFKNSLNRDNFIEMVKSVSEIIGKENLSIPDMRVDYIDEEILCAIRDYSIGWVFYGIESGSNELLKKMKKGTNTAKNLRAIKTAKECGVKVAGSFIVGHPDESEYDYLLTKDFIVDAELDDIFISAAEPIPGTELCKTVLNTKYEENPTFMVHSGQYRKYGLKENEARAYDLMMHSEMWKSNQKVITKNLAKVYLEEAKMQGADIRKVTELLFKYRNFII
ncbi:Radical SAM domain protein [Methanococcus vannielii SB]|jgi:B12-binding domain/radical SAM domain protein|uniref:Radical SAM domain protein n=1 Tax=Methanococcus vannielii (strain ATCC 35089 / DSM 1224 / JCM 13029 / OCM 148 / SB) TaxID=406327 RepID=A6UPZ5_METVS|nr:methyl-coenzyme M reductase glutamine C-methyltransferase [Methanococcus vannielii]ABR54567.1 Radical SAM domain protein [Methanococcus vannielii SB]